MKASGGPQHSPNGGVGQLLFFLGLALLLCHELDAMAQREWRLLPLLGTLPDETAQAVFVALHVPLIAVLLWLTGNQSAAIRARSQLVVDGLLVVHAALHWLLSDHECYTFHSALSRSLILGAGVVGLLPLVLLIRTAATTGRGLPVSR